MNGSGKNKAVVLLSGGVDSSTATAIARSEGHELYAISFDYNQRHRRELDSAKIVADFYKVKRHMIVKFDLGEIGGSALTSDMDVPKDRKELSVVSNNLKDTSRITEVPVTYVPARNTIFLSFALAWAEVLGAGNIFIGANAIDYSGYPDCRPEYLRAFEDMANLATKVSVEGKLRFTIRAPLILMKKSEIIKKGYELGIDYSLTWSCYDPQKKRKASSVRRKDLKEVPLPSLLSLNDYVPCGHCDSCRLREKGFKEAGLKDPLSSLFGINEA
ncbi:MAG: 7-cyano-7-deazaguanine synthase QueC [Nitrospirota bacterium]